VLLRAKSESGFLKFVTVLGKQVTSEGENGVHERTCKSVCFSRSSAV
jgi:hypothetical protein